MSQRHVHAPLRRPDVDAPQRPALLLFLDKRNLKLRHAACVTGCLSFYPPPLAPRRSFFTRRTRASIMSFTSRWRRRKKRGRGRRRERGRHPETQPGRGPGSASRPGRHCAVSTHFLERFSLAAASPNTHETDVRAHVCDPLFQRGYERIKGETAALVNDAKVPSASETPPEDVFTQLRSR